MGYGSGEGPGHGGAMGGPGDTGPSGKGGDDGGSVGEGMGPGGEGKSYSDSIGSSIGRRFGYGSKDNIVSSGMTEAQFNSRLDKYIADKGLRTSSELQKEGEARGTASIQNFQIAFDNINSQYQSHLANIFGKPGIGTPERAQMEGVNYRQPQDIGILTDKIRNTVNQTLGGADKPGPLASGKRASGSNSRSGKRS